MLKKTIYCLVVILALLEYRYWLGTDNVSRVRGLRDQVAEQSEELMVLRSRNQEILEHIRELKNDPKNIEEQARYELGMVREGEKYYPVVNALD